MSKEYTRLLKELIKAIRVCSDEKELNSLFEALLTPSELKEIPTRLEIVKRLRQGTPQREIADELGVGIATVTRGAKISSAEIFARILNNS
ncbi:MAG: helix-turn-helix domain-containing protein [Bdellovibrionales bacterium]|nr:helix-turn-helix domain-containing protein [Bdellovibrionales bacterium]